MTVPPISGALPALPTQPTQATRPAEPTGGSGFGDKVVGALDNLAATQANADNLATQAASGGQVDVHDYLIASTSASLATELTVAVRNRAVEAFNSIMQMPV